MKITNQLSIVKSANGEWTTVFNGVATVESDPTRIAECQVIYDATKGKGNKMEIYEDLVKNNMINIFVPRDENGEVCDVLSVEERVERGLQGMMDFFSEFEFEPNYRFVNSLAHKKSAKDKEDYILNYFRLLDNPYANEVGAKMKSREFKNILEDLECAPTPTKHVNTRFKVYYGSAGTGKTTLAQEESGGKCIVCNNTMLPSDIMEDFVFVNGEPSFTPSVLWQCMENGEKIVFDEINLLPFDSLRFLQGILDGKTSFDYKGHTVNIKPGFEIIGTMNLSIGGAIYGLPEPLVDRGYDFKEFKLTAKQLMNALQ